MIFMMLFSVSRYLNWKQNYYVDYDNSHYISSDDDSSDDDNDVMH